MSYYVSVYVSGFLSMVFFPFPCQFLQLVVFLVYFGPRQCESVSNVCFLLLSVLTGGSDAGPVVKSCDS